MSDRKSKAAVHAAAKSATTKVEESVELIDPDLILLDGNNPRITPVLVAEGIDPNKATQQQIADAIVKSRDWGDNRGGGRLGFTTPFNDFMNAVMKDGRINEPPVLIRMGNGKYKVLHGNNRTLVAQRAKTLMPGEGFDQVKCRVLPSDTPTEEVDKYMRIAHNPNTKQADWHPAANAHLLYSLANAEIGGLGNTNSRELQEEFGKSPKTIKDMVTAYKAMQEFIAETGDKRPLALWGIFYELYSRKSVLELYNGDEEFHDAVNKAIQEKLPSGGARLTSEHVKALPKIREDVEAWEEFTTGDGGSGTAKMMVEGEMESDNHFTRITKLSRILDDVAKKSTVKGIRKNPAKKKAVTDLVTSVRNLLERAEMTELLEPVPA